MGRLYESYVSTKLGGSINVSKGYPLDAKTVVETVDDLKNGKLLNSSYEGLVVYVVEDKSLYVCFNKPSNNKLTNVEDGWKKVDVDYSVRVVESESNITDGTTIDSPYQGIMAYVTSESSLYVLLSKGADGATDISNWRKISTSSSSSQNIDKVGINKLPEGGSGFKITENKDVIIEDYVNVENYIKADYFYTSKGVNSFDSDSNFTYDSVRLSKGGESYIELYANGDNWIAINDTDNTLGLSVSVKDGEFVMGEPIAKESHICFGVDIKFTDGWTISYGEESRPFVESDYELIDIYRSEYSPDVYAYLKDIDVRVLTEFDRNDIDDRLEDLERDGEKYKPSQSLVDMKDLTSDVHGGLGSQNAAWFKEMGYTYSQMFDEILFPTVIPTMTEPSLNWKNFSESYDRLVGSDITDLILTKDNINDYITPDLGSWSLDINSEMTASKGCGTINVNMIGRPFDNENGTYSMYTSTIKYSAYAMFIDGDDPKDNKGNVCVDMGYYNNGNIYSSDAYIYPYYNFYITTNQDAPGELVKQDVIRQSGIETVITEQGKITLSPHTTSTPWKLRLPKPLQSLLVRNTLSDKYESVEMIGDAPKMWKYEQETTTENGLKYHVYTYIGSDNNSVDIQIKF